ncbi:MAG: glycosyltransferase family 4 protein, partial [Coriobacteriia bacterium]|nr:glycosyltransferase family 4 protein [Coriobacteriia bacterium]
SAHRFVMYSPKAPIVPFTDRPLDLEWPLRGVSGSGPGTNILWMQTGVNRLLAEDRVDLFWSPRHLLPLRAEGLAKVATVQDLWHLHYPEQQPWINRTLNRALIGRIVKVSDRIVTTSQATADDIISHYGVSPGRLTVVPLGVDTSEFRRMPAEEAAPLLERLGVRGPFLLCMDVFNPRKNFAKALEAFALLPEDLRGSLGVVGLGGRRASATGFDPLAEAGRLGISDSVTLLEDVHADELVALDSTAAALVYPSVYEGFGMPVLEAMACDCPVVTSAMSSLPEVAGDAALLVDPGDARALAAAIRSIVEDDTTRERLMSAGLTRAQSFTWGRTAQMMLDVFDCVLADRARSGGGAG